MIIDAYVIYRDSLEIGAAEGLEEERLPEGVSVPEVADSLILPHVTYPVRHVLDGQGHRPDAVVRVPVESAVLFTTTGIVLHAILVSRLQAKTNTSLLDSLNSIQFRFNGFSNNFNTLCVCANSFLAKQINR